MKPKMSKTIKHLETVCDAQVTKIAEMENIVKNIDIDRKMLLMKLIFLGVWLNV